ncbi:LOW QUALITY PROTEIN: uncharacterized protein [Prorops nasuta]|uniref:LOW QUALITY PROTEIN: uncharacterized protein n=1 Tax=Prorops nasuta TaxID=863751 RepID=UPI0034CE5A7C
MHYCECISWSGPLVNQYCMRFEAKHNELKQRAQNVKNFKNPPKTLIRICQCVQALKWSSDVKISRFEVISGKTCFVKNMLSKQNLFELNYADEDTVLKAKSVKINGVEFRVNLFVILEKAVTREDNLMIFGRIEEIVTISTKVYFLTSVCNTLYFDTDVNAYCIQLDEGIDKKSLIELTQEDLSLVKEENAVAADYVVTEDGTLEKLHEKNLENDGMPVNILKRKNDEIYKITEIKRKRKDDEHNDNPTLTNEASTSRIRDLHKFSLHHDTVEKILLNSKQGVQIIKAARKGFTDSDRRSMIRILVQELINTQSPYPPHEAKMALARAIVTEFSNLKNTKSPLGFEHFYDPKTKMGFIHYRLQCIQKNLHTSDKKYHKKKKGEENDLSKVTYNLNNLNLLINDILEEKINWLKHKYPSSSNKEPIMNRMKETFLNRRSWILKESPTVSEIFNKYERLANYDGDLVDYEFSLMFPEAQDRFITKFPTFFMPRIIKYAEFSKHSYVEKHQNINDDSLKALMLLVELLPMPNSVKTKKEMQKSGKLKDLNKLKPPMLRAIEANKMLLEIVPVGTVVEDFIKVKRTQSPSPVQPYLLCVSGEVKNYFVIADNVILSRKKQSDAVSSFDLLFKLYYILNIEYPVLLQNFYNFIDTYVFEISMLKKKIASTVTSTFVNISNINLDEIEETDY